MIRRTEPLSKIAVALSGGVDSSVAALRLQEWFSGSIVGVHMSNWDYESDDTTEKCWEEDWKDAQAVAKHLKLPLVHASFQKEYWNDVFSPYMEELAKTTVTPNPDVDCNRYIKFGVLKEFLKERHDIEVLATGHYARVWDPRSVNINKQIFSGKRPEFLEEALSEDSSLEKCIHPTLPTLFAARDLSKDQSYFLSGVSATSLRNVLFPLGDLYKHPNDSTQLSVREWAIEAQLPTAYKKESMGICFIGKRKHADFLQEYIGQSLKNVGKCVHVEDGSVVAEFNPRKDHRLLYATIGQGAKLGGASQKWFVVDRPDPLTLVLCPGTHHPALYSDSIWVRDLHWIAGEPSSGSGRILAKCRIRHLQPLVDCEIVLHPTGAPTEIRFDRPLRGIAPGQVCGIYSRESDGLVCLGNGTILKRGPSYWEQHLDLPVDLHPSGHNDNPNRLQSNS